MAEPLFPILAPAAEPPRIGLLRTFTPTQVEDREVGFTFNPESCGESGVGDPDPCNTEHSKDIPDNPDTVEGGPFYIWAGDKCSPWELERRDWQSRARRQLAATRSYQIAHELWTGDQADSQGSTTNKRLASEASDVLTAGATSPTDAIARLEQGLADCLKGGRGVIHVTLHALTYLAALQLVRREGNLLLTVADTIVVADAGYTGSGPASDVADDSVWAYATGGIIVRVGPEHMVPGGNLGSGEAVDRATNTVEYRVEQKAAVGWDGCCHLAAEMDLGWLDLGGAGS